MLKGSKNFSYWHLTERENSERAFYIFFTAIIKFQQFKTVSENRSIPSVMAKKSRLATGLDTHILTPIFIQYYLLHN